MPEDDPWYTDTDADDDNHDPLDMNSDSVADGYDRAYPADYREDNRKTSGRVIGISGIPTNENALITAVQARDVWGIPLERTHRWKARKRARVLGYRGIHPLYSAPELRRLNRQADLDSRSTFSEAA